MTNYEWLNANNLYKTFIDDFNHDLWFVFIDKYGISYNPKCETSEISVILNWLNSKHPDTHRYMDIDKIKEYLRKNDTSLDCDYIRINRDKFRAFLDKQEIKYITE